MKTITQIIIGNNHFSVSRISARSASIRALYASTSDCVRKHSHQYDDSYCSKQEGSEAGFSFGGIMIGTIAILSSNYMVNVHRKRYQASEDSDVINHDVQNPENSDDHVAYSQSEKPRTARQETIIHYQKG